jgi:hypothetical protein
VSCPKIYQKLDIAKPGPCHFTENPSGPVVCVIATCTACFPAFRPMLPVASWTMLPGIIAQNKKRISSIDRRVQRAIEYEPDSSGRCASGRLKLFVVPVAVGCNWARSDTFNPVPS